MEIIRILQISWRELKNQFFSLVIATAPFLVGMIILEIAQPYFQISMSPFRSFLYTLAQTLVSSGLIFLGLKKLFEARGQNLDITSQRIFHFVFASLYIALAATIGFLVLVIPGIVVVVATYLVPIFILKEKNGPIEAVAASAKFLKPLTLQLIALFLLLWCLLTMVIFGSEALADLISFPIPVVTGLFSVVGACMALFNLSFMVNIYAHLQETRSK